jgi:hypothetical protein
MRLTRHRLARALRRVGARFVAVVLGLALIVGVLRGGSHYFYCPFMGAVASEHCCEGSRGDASTVQVADCCEVRTIGTIPAASTVAPSPELAGAPLLAVLSPLQDLSTGSIVAPAKRVGIERTGPPPLAAQRAIRSMVSRI